MAIAFWTSQCFIASSQSGVLVHYKSGLPLSMDSYFCNRSRVRSCLYLVITYPLVDISVVTSSIYFAEVVINLIPKCCQNANGIFSKFGAIYVCCLQHGSLTYKLPMLTPIPLCS
jgi:hypothetical protein